jgi:hypothetical protein
MTWPATRRERCASEEGRDLEKQNEKKKKNGARLHTIDTNPK